MAQHLNLRVIAEGVENEKQLSFLRGLRCDEIQGYYLSRPLPVNEVAQRLSFLQLSLDDNQIVTSSMLQ
jgi:EAL domain-containing protein (putative c-di-GMP-specific phosphodiesterase class I)